MRGNCWLCGQEAELQLSHVLPAFVYRWLRESAGGGHMRASHEPNRRVQDGLKRNWLCANCEGLLGRSEKAFSERLFYPYLEASGGIFQYSRWLLHFCVSVSWRVLRFFRDEKELSSSWGAEDLQRANEAEAVWRDVLLGGRPHPGTYEQHLLPLDEIAHTNATFGPSINRYVMRAIDMDVCRGTRSLFTYVKLGRFMILGFIHEPDVDRWGGAKVNATYGLVEPKNYRVPKALAGYINERSEHMRKSLESMSARQRGKVDQTLRANLENYAGSDAFRAMQADVEMYGDKAFTPFPDE